MHRRRQRIFVVIVVRAVGRIMSGHSVGKIMIIIVSFKVGTSKSKNVDHRGEETCAIMSTQVTCEKTTCVYS